MGKNCHCPLDSIIFGGLPQKLTKWASIRKEEYCGVQDEIQSLMCHRNKDGLVSVETPNKQVKDYYNQLGLTVPAHVKLNAFADDVLSMKM